MKNLNEKSLPLAIGLNLLIAGAGYLYMGKWLVGIFAMLLITGILLTTSLSLVLPVWFILNLIMGLDMWILFRKRQTEAIKENMKTCPNCAEQIQKQAKICRFCNNKLTGL